MNQSRMVAESTLRCPVWAYAAVYGLEGYDAVMLSQREAHDVNQLAISRLSVSVAEWRISAMLKSRLAIDASWL